MIDPPMAADAPHNFVGSVVDDRYEVSAELGEGAVGAVYKAMDRTTGKPVALKIWHTGSHDVQTRGRFVREAKALDVLKHPNIVEVYGYGLVDNVPYVAMEFLQGETLDDLIEKHEVMDSALAFKLFGQVLSALSFAHNLNVVHRDLKPENIFLVPGPDGTPQVRILDYGLAKFLAPEDDPLKGAAITMTGMVMGTPLYMPPEQAAGGAIDLRVDVYAAGCIFFEMLTGRLPFIGDNQMELLRAHLQAPIPLVSDVNTAVNTAPELQAIFNTAMAKKAEARYPSATQMLAALENLPPRPLRPVGELAAKAAAAPMMMGGRPTAPTDLIPQPPGSDNRSLLIGGIAAVVILLAAVVWSMAK